MIKEMKKHRKMFAVMLTLAMVFSLFSMVAPQSAEAAEIEMLKYTWQHEDDPEHPEDVYFIGQEVHYKLEIKNNHPTYSMEIEIYDIDPSGNHWYWNGTEFVETDPNYTETILAGEEWTYDFHYIIDEEANLVWNDFYGTYGIVNRLGAYGTQGPEDVDASVTKTIQVVQPDISVTKEASHETSKAGDVVTYAICIENTGDWALEDITVIDDMLGDLSEYFPDTLPVYDPEDPEANKACYDYDYTVQENDPDPLLNVVDVWGTAYGFDPAIDGAVATDSASASVDLVYPGLAITKEADTEVSKVGDSINYTVVVSNTGDVELEVVVDDTLEGQLFDGMVAAGASETFEYEYIVQEGDPDPLVNTATAVGTLEYLGLDNVYTVNATHEMDLVNPDIRITKTVYPDTAQIGDTVTYTICIENIGDWGLENIVVNDTLLGGPLAGFPDTLAVGDAPYCLDFDYVIQEGDVVDGEVVNTARVDSNPVGLDNDIWDEDYAVVTIEELEVVCETAWAYGGEEADEVVENNSLPGTGNAWGWTNKVGTVNEAVYHYEFDLYTGAAQNDITKGTWVGTVTVHIEGEDSWVRYEIGDGMDCWFSELHLWVGDTELPETRRGYTAAPGQFNYSAYPDDTEYTFYFDVSELEEIWVAAHAVVCCYEVME